MPERLHLDVEHCLAATSAARHAVRTWDALPEPLRWSTELVCGELLANGVRHGLPPVRLDIDVDGTHVRVAVSDGAPTIGPPSTTSRGLGIVGSVTEHWGVDYGPEGKTVWAELAVPAAPPAAPTGDPSSDRPAGGPSVPALGDVLLRAQTEHLQRIYEHAQVGIAIADTEGTFLASNAAYQRILGYTDDELHERSFASLVHPDDRAANVALYAQLIAGEIPAFDVENRYLRKDGTVVWVHKVVLVLASDQDRPSLMVAVVTDITQRKVAEEALRARVEADQRARCRAELWPRIFGPIERVEGVRPRAQLLCDLLVAHGARVALLLCSADSRTECAFSAADGARSRVLETLAGTAGHSPAAIGAALGAHDALQATVDTGAVFTASLVVIDNTNPLIDGAFVDELAERAGVLLASARVREEEQTIALRLQQALLPNQLHEHPMLRIRARYHASGEIIQVGGDWYDAFELDDGLVGISVGDVVGHGLDAASTMGRLRTAAAALAPRSTSPGELLTHLDDFARGPNGTSFATATYAVLDPATRLLRYASAGHLPALVVAPNGCTRWLDEGRSGPLAVLPARRRAEARTRLAPGSLVLWCSDGLVERRTESIDRGLQRLADTVRQHRTRPLDDLCDAVIGSLTADQQQEDDIVLLCLRLAA